MEGTDEKADQTSGVFKLDTVEPSKEVRIPISHLFCPMSGLLTLTLKDEAAKVEVKDLEYYAGSISGFDKRDPSRVHEVWGAVRGQALDATLRKPGFFGIEGWFVNTRETSASVMLISPYPPRVSTGSFGGSCSHISYGTYELEGEAYLSLQLTLVEGDAAEVGYNVEWFPCLPNYQNPDGRAQEVCDLAWNELYDKVVGQSYETSSCPFLGNWCRVWEAAFGEKTGIYAEEDVEDAVMEMCREPAMVFGCQ